MTQVIENLEIEKGTTVECVQNVLTVKGPKGEVVRKLYVPGVVVKVENNQVVFSAAKKFTLRHKRLINTYKAHLKNIFRGVTAGHSYVLKICSGHFPINVALKGKNLEVKNLFGETIPRILEIPEGAHVKVEGDKVNVTGVDKELVSRCAASIEQLTRRPGFDKRVFQDGAYIIEKDGRPII